MEPVSAAHGNEFNICHLAANEDPPAIQPDGHYFGGYRFMLLGDIGPSDEGRAAVPEPAPSPAAGDAPAVEPELSTEELRKVDHRVRHVLAGLEETFTKLQHPNPFPSCSWTRAVF